MRSGGDGLNCVGYDNSGVGACRNPLLPGRAIYTQSPRRLVSECRIAGFGEGTDRQPVLVGGGDVLCPWCWADRMADAEVRESDLDPFGLAQLRSFCDDFGLDRTGRRGPVTARILADKGGTPFLTTLKVDELKTMTGGLHCVRVPVDRTHTHRLPVRALTGFRSSPDNLPPDPDPGY